MSTLESDRNTGSVAELTALFQKEQDYYLDQCQYFFAE